MSHADLGEWLRPAHPQLTGDLVSNRGALIEKVKKLLSTEQVIELLPAVFRNEAQVPSFFVEALLGADPAFPRRDNAFELRILAAASIIELLNKPSATADAAALAVVCASASDLRSEDPSVSDLVPLSERYLYQRGQDVRAARAYRAVPAPDLKKPLQDAITALATINQAAATQLQDLLPKLVEGQVGLSRAANQSLKEVNEGIATVREQLDVIWWAFSKRLLTSGEPVAGIELPELTLRVASDLDLLTRLIPGPVAAPAFLAEMLHSGRKKVRSLSFRDAVDAADMDWVRTTIQRPLTAAREYVCPLTAALYRRGTVGNSAGWADGWASVLNVDAQIEPSKVAYQFYCELLLLRSVAGTV